MKKFFSGIICIVAPALTIQAQPVLFGLTNRGGIANSGVIISYQVAISNFSVVKSFESIEQFPKGSLVKASNGKFYGVTSSGGIGFGVIFSFDASTGIYAKLKDFDYT